MPYIGYKKKYAITKRKTITTVKVMCIGINLTYEINIEDKLITTFYLF